MRPEPRPAPGETHRGLEGDRAWVYGAFAVWGLVLLAVSAAAWVNGVYHPGKSSVYPIFARAARDWLAGADLYAHAADPYRYSPLVAVLLVPFGLLPDA